METRWPLTQSLTCLKEEINKEYKDFMPYEMFSDRELRERFRFGHEGIRYLSDLLRPKLERVTRRGHALTVE